MWSVGGAVTSLGHIGIVRGTILLLALERHIEVLSDHSTVAEEAETEGDILLPEAERHEAPAQLHIVRSDVETLHTVTHNTADGAVATHTVAVVVSTHYGNEG